MPFNDEYIIPSADPDAITRYGMWLGAQLCLNVLILYVFDVG